MNESDAYRLLFEHNPDLTLLIDANGKILKANRAFCESLRLDLQEIVGKDFADLLAPAFRSELDRALQSLSSTGRFSGEFALTKEDGRIHWFEWTAQSQFNHGSIIWSGREVTQRKLWESNQRDEIKKKENQLQDIHHRMKNTLQLLTELVQLHEPGASESHPPLSAFKNRLEIMAGIHDGFYQDGVLKQETELCTSLRQVAQGVCRSLGIDEERVQITAKGEPVHLDYERALMCSLIAHELISNSLKYAADGTQAAKVCVNLSLERGTIRMEVQDHAGGLPEPLQIQEAMGSGLKLVQSLTEQLKGNLELRNCPGAKFIVRFPDEAGCRMPDA